MDLKEFRGAILNQNFKTNARITYFLHRNELISKLINEVILFIEFFVLKLKF